MSRQQSQLIAARYQVSGPLPSADELERYNALVPDMADRLLVNLERQTAHRIDLEKKVIEGDIRRSTWGLVLGFIFAMALLAASVYLLATGRQSDGVLLFLTEMIGLGLSFVYSDIRRRQERKGKGGG